MVSTIGLRGGILSKSRWRNANAKDPRTRNKYRRKILLDELRKKHQEARQFRDAIKPEEIALFQDMTYIKKSILRWSIQRLNDAERVLVQKRHDKKYNNLLQEKNRIEGTAENPNKNHLELFIPHTL